MKWFLLLLAVFFWLVAFLVFGASSTVVGQGIAASFVVSGTVALVGFALVDRLDASVRAAHANVQTARATRAAVAELDPYAGA